MTTLDAMALIEYLERCGLLSIPMEKHDYEKTVANFQKKNLPDHWTDKFFTPTKTENK